MRCRSLGSISRRPSHLKATRPKKNETEKPLLYRPLRYGKQVLRKVAKRYAAYKASSDDFGAYRRWLKSHSSGDFKEFYVDTIKGHLTGEGGAHSTLGLHPIWEAQGQAVLQQLIEQGLTPTDTVVDYGCGTLREGVHFIRYLEAGHYIGLDIDDRVLQGGRRLVGPELLAWKKPFLAIITAEVIEKVAALRPAWIVSSYVLSQVAPQDLDEYLDNLAKLMEGGARSILQVRLAWRTMQYSKTGWYHCRRRMTRRLTKRGLVVLQMRTRELTSKPHKVRGVEARLIVGQLTSNTGVRSLSKPERAAAFALLFPTF
jgi:SAM-dependent methyltransferase